MFCGTFLKLSTLKILLGPPRISPLYKFIGMFDRLSTSFYLFIYLFIFFFWGGGDLWFIVRVRERLGFGFRLG